MFKKFILLFLKVIFSFLSGIPGIFSETRIQVLPCFVIPSLFFLKNINSVYCQIVKRMSQILELCMVHKISMF